MVLLVILVATVASAVGCYLVQVADRDRVRSMLELRAEWRTNDLRGKLSEAADPIRSAALLVSSQAGLSAEDFRRFVQDAIGGTEDVQRIRWAPWVSGEQRSGFEAAVRATGLGNFRIWQLSGDPATAAATRDAYVPTLWEAGPEPSGVAPGLDLLSNPVLRPLLQSARDQVRPVSALIQPSAEAQAGRFLNALFWPIHGRSQFPGPAEGRRSKLRGFVIGLMRPEVSLTSAIAGTPMISETIQAYVGRDGRSGPDVALGTPVAYYVPRADAFRPGLLPLSSLPTAYRIARSFDLFGQRWTFVFSFSPAEVAELQSANALAWFLGGLLLTASLAAYVLLLQQQRERVQSMVDERATELLHVNEELDRIRRFLDAVIENVPGMLLVTELRRGRVVLISRDAEEVIGRPRSGIVGKTGRELFPSGGGGLLAAELDETRRSGGTSVSEQTVTMPDGTAHILRTRYVPILGEDGRPKFLLSLSEDVTERRQVQAAFRQVAETLRAVVEASPLGIAALTPDNEVTVWNPAAEQILGVTAAEVTDRPDTLLDADENRGELAALVERLRQGEAVKGAQIRMRRKDGQPVELSVSGAALQDRSRSIQGFVVAFEDTTERRLTEAQLQQSQRMEAVGQLTGGLAHDFNNLLGIVIGNLDALGSRLVPGSEAAELLGEAMQAALRGADLNRRLLAFARKQPLQPRRLDVNELVSGIAKLLRRTIGASITIRLDLASDLWPVRADPSQVEASLTNLCVNARDAMPNGGELTIATFNVQLGDDDAEASAEVAPGEYVLLQVSDTGHGIPPEILGRVFEPFFTTKEVGKGTGLGLSMVFGFVKQSGGHVRIDSEPGHGTSIRLYLPRLRTEAPAAAEPEAPPAARAIVGGEEAILVVEDNDKLRAVLTRQLAELGYEVRAVKDGRSAMDVLGGGCSFDLLVSDVVMPGGINGVQLAEEARALCPGLEVLLTSGFPDLSFGTHTQLPADLAFLPKPYRKAELAAKVRELLSGRVRAAGRQEAPDAELHAKPHCL